jgi:viologen exporter family transport system permease protein
VPSAVSAYRKLFQAGIRSQSTYKLAMLAGLSTNTVFGFIRYSILTAAQASATGAFAGYTHGSISAYVWISQGLLGSVPMHANNAEISDRIRSGDVAIDIARPLDLQAATVVTDLGKSAYAFLPRGLPSVFIGALVVGLAMPTSPLGYVLGLVSVAIGIGTACALRFAVCLMGFWLVETRGFRNLYMVLATFLAGLYLPVPLFPDWLRTLATATPFPTMLQTPIDVISGRTAGLAAANVLVIQACWLLFCLVLGRLMLVRGRRRLEVQGG